MKIEFPSFPVDRAIPLHGRDYYDVLRDEVAAARTRVWASIFIVDVNRASDPDLLVRDLLKEIASAAERGLDVRVIVGDSKTVPSIRFKNRVARAFLRNRRVQAVRYAAASPVSTHNKFVVLDNDRIILGSHNWTHRAFTASDEDSVAVVSSELNAQLRSEFLWAWNQTRSVLDAERAAAEARRSTS